nr:MAG TPA: Protein of unknown function (DUF2283) [Caudoviricetes sp.]
MQERIRANYDKKYDILYIAMGDKTNSYCDDDGTGLLISRDFETEEITGFTIFDFYKRFLENRLPKLPAGYDIDYKKDILPYLN